MKSYKSFLSLAFVVAAVLAASVQPAKAIAYTGEPSQGATITGHGVAKDGNGTVFANGNADLGWKVWIATDTNPHVIADELGNAAVAGLVHAVCMSSGTVAEWGVVYDSNTVGSLTVANSGTNALLQVTDTTQRLAAAHACQVYDSQFWNGAVLLQSGNTGGGTVQVYWRPARGGSN